MKNSTKCLIICGFYTIALWSCNSNKEQAVNEQGDNTPQQADVMSARNAAIMGYESLYTAQTSGALKHFWPIELGDSSEVILGDSVGVFYVGINDLATFRSDATLLAKFADELLYPVKSGDETLSGIVVKRKDRQWQFTGVVTKDFSKSVDSTRSEIIKSGVRRERPYLLNIPSLYLSFVATKLGNKLNLVSMTSNSTLGVVEGEEYDADSLFTMISAKLKTKEIQVLEKETFSEKLKQ